MEYGSGGNNSGMHGVDTESFEVARLEVLQQPVECSLLNMLSAETEKS